MKHALPRPLAGDDGNSRPWPTLPGDPEPSRDSWTVILDGTSGKGGGR
ncbi:hypothetical protein Ga0074812_11545 [Parafrankia irregularis]|uniref:Uncharacterized protein n=1 Tax=Parafrankia irregularis TaxID=795642 RepID=A0A0S4QQV1_9ACTN|nr:MULTISPECIES: hypothetical protein [Parafrankia]MBE3202659.1 hypothetical protein [Parafrankia sp. CH37]CUU57843.1 hypothetical protein Ga0074812_11545 [Parafrankia irregularis]